MVRRERIYRFLWFILFGGVLVFLYFFPTIAQEKVPFPDGWENFVVVEEGVIGRGDPLFSIIPGYHRTYLNDIAYEHFKKYIKTYKSEGREKVPPFPEGSLIVFVNFKDDKGKEPILFAVMHKKKEYGQTGGWGWEAFKMPGKERIVTDPDKDCANCHYKSELSWDGAFFSHWKEK